MALETVRIKTTGMHCGSCSMLVQMTLEDLPGVAEARADVAGSMTEVTFDSSAIDAASLVEAIEKAGYGAEVAS
jgi:copper chaperone CopZ